MRTKLRGFTLVESVICLAIVALISSIIFSACKPREESASIKEKIATEKAMQEQMRAVGMPAITNWQEKKLFKMIYELRDKEDLICYAYIVDMHGKLHFLTKCIGYGIPYSTQYTSPERPEEDRFGNYTLPQADPNGMYMPEGLSATWIIAVDEKGETRPIYVEPEIIVSPVKLDSE